MENSAQQIANVAGAFETSGSVPTRPILLVDDICDSRWTMTIMGELLITNGSGPVYPFAVGKTKG
jgi:ATP-dependent DNA helicase RecQ